MPQLNKMSQVPIHLGMRHEVHSWDKPFFIGSLARSIPSFQYEKLATVAAAANHSELLVYPRVFDPSYIRL